MFQLLVSGFGWDIPSLALVFSELSEFRLDKLSIASSLLSQETGPTVSPSAGATKVNHVTFYTGFTSHRNRESLCLLPSSNTILLPVSSCPLAKRTQHGICS
jgi:hypothetical protein